MIKIRPLEPADMPAIAAIHVDVKRDAYTAIMSRDYLIGLSKAEDQERFTEWIFGPEPWAFGYAACVDEKVVGFVLAGANEGDPAGYEGEIFKLFVLPEYQGRGLGILLLLAAAEALQARSYEKVAIWVYRDSRATHFYEKFGGEIVFRTVHEVGGRPLPINIYGWTLADLVERLRDQLIN